MARTNKKKSLSVNAILNILKTVLGVIFPLITYPYITRVLNVENIGIFNFSNSIVGYFSLFAAFGVGTYAVREGAKRRDSVNELRKVGCEIFTINMITTIIAYMALIILLAISTKLSPYREIILILSISFIFTTIGIDWLNSVYEDFLYITIRTILFQIISLVLLFIFVRSADDLYAYTWISLLSSTGASILNGIYCRRKYINLSFHFSKSLLRHIKPMTLIFLSNITTTIFVNSDQTMIGLMCGNYNVGIYAVAVKIYNVIKNIFTAVLLVAVPRVSYMVSNDNQDRVNEFCSNIAKILTIVVLPMAVGTFFISDKIVLIIAGYEYIEAVKSLRILAISILCAAAASYMTYMYIVPQNKENILLLSSSVSAGANVVLNLLMIRLFQQDGAAFTTVLSELIVFIIELLSIKPKMHIKSIAYNFLQVVIACMGIVAINYIIRAFISNLVISTVVIIIGSAFVYGLVLLLLRNTTMLSLLKRIMNKIRK